LSRELGKGLTANRGLVPMDLPWQAISDTGRGEFSRAGAIQHRGRGNCLCVAAITSSQTARTCLGRIPTRSKSSFGFPPLSGFSITWGNLLFAQRQTKSAEWEGFCHGFATVVRELSRLAYESPDCAWILVANRIPRQQISNLLTRRSPS
jgi:hypothetical protein